MFDVALLLPLFFILALVAIFSPPFILNAILKHINKKLGREYKSDTSQKQQKLKAEEKSKEIKSLLVIGIILIILLYCCTFS